MTIPMELMSDMDKAGFPKGEFLITKQEAVGGLNIWFSDNALHVLADLCVLAQWYEGKPVIPAR